jgi:hypothetical protein
VELMAADTNGAEPDPRIVALGRTTERTARRVGELDAMLRRLAADVLAIAKAQTTGGADSGNGDQGGSGVRSWLLAEDPDQARVDVADLAVWLQQVYLRYQDAGLPSCWLWHPDVVEELWWLRQAHAEAFHPQNGSWRAVADWHDRQRPNLVRRLRPLVNKCELPLHAPGQEQGGPPATVPLAAHADAIAYRWTTTPGRHVPPPEGGQLVEAERYTRESFRSRR